jgi:hypothetical protein
MRHSRISTTMGIYAQIVPSSQRRALQQLSAFAAGGAQPEAEQIAPVDLGFSASDGGREARSKMFQIN